MSETEKEKMDKKTNSRQSYSVQKQNGTDSKKDIASRNQRFGKRRGSNNSGGGNYSYDSSNRKPTPQKSKNAFDKRPRQRGEFTTGSGGDLEEDDLSVEYGSAIQAGSRKGNLNHLLNFTYEHELNPGASSRGSGYGGGARWSRGRQVHYRSSYSRSSKMCYNKEQFLQANCQFVVKESGDYSVHLMDPDVLVNWESVEQVRVVGTEPPSCPICLQYPVAAKMTRCGHIYCWACILHYLALGEKSWRKCPICYESVHFDDLKSVITREVHNYKVGDEITLTLMKKEKGSIYAVPANLWHKQPGKCHNVSENEEITRHVKLLTANPEQVMNVIDIEKQELMVQLVDAESSEEPFIRGAQDQIAARQMKVLGVSEVKKEVEDIVEQSQTVEPDVPVSKYSSNGKKIKQYRSAFSDEEEDTQPPVNPDNTACTGEVDNKSVSGESPTSSYVPERRKSSPPLPIVPTNEENKPAEDQHIGSPEAKEPPIEMIPEIMPVEEAAEHLELPTQSGNKTRNKSGENAFYFYQADDGQHIYLHSLNARCLVKEYGSLEHCPQKITANIVEKESVFVTEELRKRLRYLSHLPLTCGFEVVELALKPPLVNKDTLKHFADDIEKRKRLRQRRARDDKRMARLIEDQERKRLGLASGTIVRSQFQQQQQQSGSATFGAERLSDTRSDTSSPSVDTPIGSPLGLNVHAEEFQPGTSPGDEGNQTSVVSFAQMLKAGSKTTVWPKAKSDNPVSPLSPSSGRTGSDESDNEDKIPVPKYQNSFGSALEAAFENIEAKTEGSSPQASGSGNVSAGGSGKKKKKQLVLFSTSMARGGK